MRLRDQIRERQPKNVNDQEVKGAVSKDYAVSRFVQKVKGKEVIACSDDDLDLLLEILNEDLFDGALTGRPLRASKKGSRTTTRAKG